MRRALQHIKRVQQAQESAGLPGDWAVMAGQQCIADDCPQIQAGNGDCAQQDSIGVYRTCWGQQNAMHGRDICVEPQYLHIPAVQTL